jgi:Trk K+ transport system NAD-binding subunit
MWAGVVALTDGNETNRKIAITSKLLHPDITVICRSDSHDVEANMASFGTDYIIDPFDTFAVHLATALDSPALYLLHQWLTGTPRSKLREPVYPPGEGTWVVCGYGRFGKAVYGRLKRRGVDVIVVEAEPEKTGVPDDRVVVGRGTEAATLLEASIIRATGLVAGTDNDANNLSIIMTARELNPDLFVLARQNHEDNQPLLDAVNADIIMQPSSIIANRIRMLLANPMLYEFMQLAKSRNDDWACELVSRIIAVVSDLVPEIWEVTLTEDAAPVAWDYVNRTGGVITVGDLLRSRVDRDVQLPAVPLMISHDNGRVLVPPRETSIRTGDSVLWCGLDSARREMLWVLNDERSLAWSVTGEMPIQSHVLRALFAKQETPSNQK